MFKASARLLFINVTGLLAVGLSTYYPGLDLVMSGLFILVVGMEARHHMKLAPRWSQRLLIPILAQIPGILLAAAFFLDLERYWDWVWYSQFTLELWDLPVLPLISLLPADSYLHKPLYYYAIFAAVPLQGLLYWIFQIKPLPVTESSSK